MKKAGLNPILAYSKGGASTPGGAQATIGDFGRAPASALQAMQARTAEQNVNLNSFNELIEKDKAAIYRQARKHGRKSVTVAIETAEEALEASSASTLWKALTGRSGEPGRTGARKGYFETHGQPNTRPKRTQRRKSRRGARK